MRLGTGTWFSSMLWLAQCINGMVPKEHTIMLLESNNLNNGYRMEHCDENLLVSSWCDESINPQVECSLWKQLNQYGCYCYDNHAACPTECIGGKKPTHVSQSSIHCHGIPPPATPNYILKSSFSHTVHRDDQQLHCEGNAIVSSWCDESIDPHHKCTTMPHQNTYVCHCHGNAASCPIDCIDGKPPHKRTKYSIHCFDIPLDEPNYIIQPEQPTFKTFLFNSSKINEH